MLKKPTHAYLMAAIGLLAVGGFGLAGCSSSQPGEEAATAPPVVESTAPATPVAAGEVLHVSEADFEKLVLKSSEPVLVDFYADWCGPCQKLAPIVADFAKESPKIRVVKVDTDKNQGLVEKYGIRGIPALKVFKNGEVVAETEGLISKQELKSLVDA